MEGPNHPYYQRYCSKVSQDIPFRICEGLLGKYAGLSEPGYMFPWDWSVLNIVDENGRAPIPGKE
eukprot:4638561-Alexandrium_andersonii.AAC.1